MTAARDYPKLDVLPFGEELLLTNDLDPIYVALSEMQMPDEQLQRWCIAYWCFYSAGVACHMSQLRGNQFWAEMLVAAENAAPAPHGGRWERGKERRHFRGTQGVLAVGELKARYGDRPEGMIDHLSENEGEEPLPFAVVSERAKEHRGFGDWISFKVGDMLERVLKVPVDFQEAEVFMFDTPRKAAVMVYDQYGPDAKAIGDHLKIGWSVRHLAERFGGMLAPPHLDRPVGLQELETILCKWKSHMSGHYPLMNDIHEIRQGLQPWVGKSLMVEEFLACMPQGAVTAGEKA